MITNSDSVSGTMLLPQYGSDHRSRSHIPLSAHCPPLFSMHRIPNAFREGKPEKVSVHLKTIAVEQEQDKDKRKDISASGVDISLLSVSCVVVRHSFQVFPGVVLEVAVLLDSYHF